MAFFYGNVYIAVLTKKLANSHVLMITKMPSPVDNSSACYIPYDSHELKTFKVYEEEDKAKAALAVRQHILDSSEQEVFDLVYSIEAAKMDVQRIRLLKQKENLNSIDGLNETVKTKKDQLKIIHAIRRAKIKELFNQAESSLLIK